MSLPFHDRTDAGRQLASKLRAYAHRPDVLVLALPRGGVPVAFEVVRKLKVSLDLLLVRKLGVPGHEELAMGALASGGIRVVNDDVVKELGISRSILDQAAAREEKELARREKLYRGERPPPEIRGHTLILVDDGLATGSSMRAALSAVRARGPARVVVAVPIAAAAARQELQQEADELVFVETADPFFSVGFWYRDFSQVSDQEIRGLLDQAAPRERAAKPS